MTKCLYLVFTPESIFSIVSVLIKRKPGNLIAHRTFHRYTVRAKQGGMQSVNDKTRGVSHSAGATLRSESDLFLLKRRDREGVKNSFGNKRKMFHEKENPNRWNWAKCQIPEPTSICEKQVAIIVEKKREKKLRRKQRLKEKKAEEKKKMMILLLVHLLWHFKNTAMTCLILLLKNIYFNIQFTHSKYEVCLVTRHNSHRKEHTSFIYIYIYI
uniref:BVLRF1 domain-containing protein n=1 Tax=Heterorhabditis bacteriophora TaxID=37862 RepID=A0A1I7WCP3_HETBA